MPKKVLFICSSFMVSGKEFVTLHTAQGLTDAGYEIEFIINGWTDGMFETLLQQRGWTFTKAKLGWFYVSRPLWTLDTLVHLPGALWKIRKKIKQFQPNIIYFDSYKPIVALSPLLGRIPVVHHVNDPNATRKTDRFFIQHSDKNVSRYIAASNFIKRDLMDCGVADPKITVIHNGVDVPLEFEKNYLDQSVIRIGIVGQVIPRKGHIDLINGCKILHEKGISFVLRIFGNGPEDHLQTLKNEIDALGITPYVEWKGFEKEKANIYNQIDVLVAPTINEEPFALVALESSLYRVPVIASRSGGFPESVIDGETGFIIDKHAPEQIAQQVMGYFQNPEVLKKHGSAARTFALKDFTNTAMHQKLVHFFHQTIDQTNSR